MMRRASLVALLAIGCERVAPGPDECVAFAQAWLHARRPASRLEADTAFDELVRHCLTEPYDRELVGCVVSSQVGRSQLGDDSAGSDRIGSAPTPEHCRIDYARRLEARREERSR
jgi:hypothetical protein